MSFFGFPLPPSCWPPPEPDSFFVFDQHSVSPHNNAKNNFLVGILILTLVLTFASSLAVLAINLSRSCLSCRSLLLPLPKQSTSIGSEVLLVATVLNANWLRRASKLAWNSLRTCSYVISRARFMARCYSNSHRTRASKCGCLDVIIQSCGRLSTRFAPLVPADQFLPFLKSCGKISQFASICNQNLS